MIILNHNVAGNQPISDLISNVDLAFKIGILFGFTCGFIIAILIYSVYRDIKEQKKELNYSEVRK